MGQYKTKRHLGEKFFGRSFGKKNIFDDSDGGEANIFWGGKILETCSPNPGSCRTVTAEAGIDDAGWSSPLAIAVSGATWACQAWTHSSSLSLSCRKGSWRTRTWWEWRSCNVYAPADAPAATGLMHQYCRMWKPELTIWCLRLIVVYSFRRNVQFENLMETGFIRGARRANRPKCTTTPSGAVRHKNLVTWKMTSLIKSRPWGITRPSRSTKGGWDDIVSNLFQSQLRKCEGVLPWKRRLWGILGILMEKNLLWKIRICKNFYDTSPDFTGMAVLQHKGSDICTTPTWYFLWWKFCFRWCGVYQCWAYPSWWVHFVKWTFPSCKKSERNFVSQAMNSDSPFSWPTSLNET